MTKTNFVFFDADRNCVAYVFGDGDNCNREHETTRIRDGLYVRSDDGRQICDGGSYSGNTLVWNGDGEAAARSFAKQCDAKFYKTRASFDRAVTEMYGDEPEYV